MEEEGEKLFFLILSKLYFVIAPTFYFYSFLPCALGNLFAFRPTFAVQPSSLHANSNSAAPIVIVLRKTIGY